METEATEVTEVEETEAEAVESTETQKKTDWQHTSRKWENTARREKKAREELEVKLRDKDELDKSATEKAIEAARQEGESTARTAAEKERRTDRLENQTIKLATKGVQIEDDDGNKVTLRFADSDDAFAYIERALRRGDLDEEDIFGDDGKVNAEGLTRALQELLVSKPHLAASSGGAKPKVAGSADGGKGSGGGKAPDELSPEEWLAKIRKAA